MDDVMYRLLVDPAASCTARRETLGGVCTSGKEAFPLAFLLVLCMIANWETFPVGCTNTVFTLPVIAGQ